MRTRLALTLVFALGTVPAGADPWPQWRGPQLNGVSRDTDVPLRWSAKDNVAWRLALPEVSGSTPIVWGDHVFLSVGEGEALSLWAVDRATGQVRWKRPLGGGNRRRMKQQMTSPSPVTDGTSVWVMTGTGVVKAFDTAGRERWARDLQKEYGTFGLQWGYASSPLLHDGQLYVQVLHGWTTDDPSYVMRIDGASGRTVWKVERRTRARAESADAYTTPTVWRHAAGTDIVVTGADVVTAYDPSTGAERWRAAGLNPDGDGWTRIVASPVVFGDLLIAPSKERPLLALRPGGRGDVGATHVRWTFNNGPDVPTPVTDGTYLYSINDRGILYCLDVRSGTPAYPAQRLRNATYTGSPVLAGGRLYVTDEDGVTSVVQAGPQFRLLAENDLGDYTLSSPAVSDGQIFIRTAGALHAIGARKTPAPAVSGGARR